MSGKAPRGRNSYQHQPQPRRPGTHHPQQEVPSQMQFAMNPAQLMQQQQLVNMLQSNQAQAYAHAAAAAAAAGYGVQPQYVQYQMNPSAFYHPQMAGYPMQQVYQQQMYAAPQYVANNAEPQPDGAAEENYVDNAEPTEMEEREIVPVVPTTPYIPAWRPPVPGELKAEAPVFVPRQRKALLIQDPETKEVIKIDSVDKKSVTLDVKSEPATVSVAVDVEKARREFKESVRRTVVSDKPIKPDSDSEVDVLHPAQADLTDLKPEPVLQPPPPSHQKVEDTPAHAPEQTQDEKDRILQEFYSKMQAAATPASSSSKTEERRETTPTQDAAVLPAPLSAVPAGEPNTVNEEQLSKVASAEATAPAEDVKSLVPDGAHVDEEEEDEREGTAPKETEPELDLDPKETELPLAHLYEPGKWSPSNPSGEKSYARMLLYELRFSPLAKDKPKGLNVVDSLFRPQQLQHPPVARVSSRHSDRGGHGGGRQGGGGHRGGSNQWQDQQQQHGPRDTIFIDRGASDKQQGGGLHKSSNPYKRRQATSEEETILRQARAILNKLTPENFTKLAEGFMHLPTNNEHMMRSVVELIFDKAVEEPHFSEGYATLCSLMRAIEVPKEENPEERLKFQGLLLLKCQKEFENPDLAKFDYDVWDQKMASAATDAERAGIKEEKEEELGKSKRRTVGTVQFIGELYKQKILNLKLMHLCLQRLLVTKNDEGNLECLCKLLKTVGTLLDGAADKGGSFGQCMNRIQEIIDEKAVSIRIVFLLQDIVELRQHKWIPRRKENDPKKRDKIREEAEREQHFQQKSDRRGRDDRPRNKGGRNQHQNQHQQHQSNVDSEGYTTVVKTHKSKQDDKERIERIRTLDATNMSFKPQAFNRFNALTKESSPEQKGGLRPSSSLTLGRQELTRPEIPKRGSTGPETEDKMKMRLQDTAAAGLSPAGSSPRQSNEGTPASSRASSISRQGDRGEPFTLEAVERRVGSTLKELYHQKDLKEAILSFEESNFSEHQPEAIRKMVEVTFESSPADCKLLGVFLRELLKSSFFNVESFISAFSSLFEMVEDLEIDFGKKIYGYFGEVMAPIYESGAVGLKTLVEVCQPLREFGKAGVLVSAIGHAVHGATATVAFSKLWRDEAMSLADFLSQDDDEDQFVEDHALEWLVDGTAVEEFWDMVCNEAVSEEGILTWLSENVKPKRQCSEAFTADLVIRLFEGFCQTSQIKDQFPAEREPDLEKVVNGRSQLLKHIIATPNLELAAMYALLKLMVKLNHPRDLLVAVVQKLNEADVLSAESIKAWIDDKTRVDVKGKGVAVTALKHWLEAMESQDAQE